jgi:hypothetical protein
VQKKRAMSQSREPRPTAHRNIEISEGTVYSQKYYTAKPVFGPWPTGFYNQYWEDMLHWHVETFGPTVLGSFNARWYVSNATFWYRDPEDLTLFLLKWK